MMLSYRNCMRIMFVSCIVLWFSMVAFVGFMGESFDSIDDADSVSISETEKFRFVDNDVLISTTPLTEDIIRGIVEDELFIRYDSSIDVDFSESNDVVIRAQLQFKNGLTNFTLNRRLAYIMDDMLRYQQQLNSVLFDLSIESTNLVTGSKQIVDYADFFIDKESLDSVLRWEHIPQGLTYMDLDLGNLWLYYDNFPDLPSRFDE